MAANKTKPTGRPPSKPTEAQARVIVEGRAKGLTWERCAGAARITAPTLAKWRHKGETGEEPYATFLSAVEKAEADAVTALLDTIKAASFDTWTAAAWLLERRYPQTYGRRVQEVQGKDGGPVRFEIEWQRPIEAGEEPGESAETEG